MRINSRAWTGPFIEQDWDEIASRYHGAAEENPKFRHLANIVDSVLACGGADRLAGLTTMDGLVVTARPVPEQPPVEFVVVGLSWPGQEDGVVIKHCSTTGYDDKIFRSGEQAVPLFWRFMIEKFGVAPDRRSDRAVSG